jgi:septin family protein
VDVEYLRQLSPLTNIIILLAQTDLMSSEQVAASKNQILSQLKEADIRLFSFS